MPPPDSPAAPPRRRLAELGLSPGRRRGQTFLHDKNIARKIVAAARKMGPPFLEIGAGLGALTSLLAAGGGETVAVEGGRRLGAPRGGGVAGAGAPEGGSMAPCRYPSRSWPKPARNFPSGKPASLPPPRSIRPSSRSGS